MATRSQPSEAYLDVTCAHRRALEAHDDPGARRATNLLAGLYALTMGMNIPLIFQHLEVTFSASPTTIGAIAALSGGVQVAVRIPIGRLIDARGEHGTLAASWLLTALSGVLFMAAGTVGMVALAFAVFSVGMGAYWVAANTLATHLAPPGRLAHTMTRYMVAVGFGFMVGPILGGIADIVGFRAALGSFVVLGLAGYVARAALPARPVPAGDEPRPSPHARADARGLWLGVSAAFFFGFLLGAADAFVPVHLAAAGFSALAVGSFFSAREGVNFATRLGSQRFVHDHNAAVLLAAGTLVEAVGLVVFPRASTVLGLGLAALATGFGIGLLGPSSLTLTAQGSTRGATGRAMGRYGTALGLGLLVGPAITGPIGDAFGLVHIFDLVAGLSLVLALVAAASAWAGRGDAAAMAAMNE